MECFRGYGIDPKKGCVHSQSCGENCIAASGTFPLYDGPQNIFYQRAAEYFLLNEMSPERLKELGLTLEQLQAIRRSGQV